MSRTAPRTDLAFIRRVLAHADASTAYAAARAHGLSPHTVYRWMERRATREHPAWPTEAEIAAWRADQEQHRAARDRVAAHAREYRKRVYLARGGVQVPALGTVRRLRALAALGWTTGEVGGRLGVSAARVQHLQAGMYPMVFPSTATAVRRVFAELAMTVPTDPAPTRPREIRIHARTRNLAARKGWAPPLAYDDIDDPAEQPQGVGWQPRPANDATDRASELSHLADSGVSLTEACARLGITRKGLEKWCDNHGRRDLWRRLVGREEVAA